MSINTYIKILKDIPLDNTYRDTIFFDTQANQSSYFNSKVVFTLTENTYQRIPNVMRISIAADKLYDCNYLMFSNINNYKNKTFYAFITEIKYINETTTELAYEIDVMQTWHFDYTFNPSFVEREHAATDNIGDNLVPEVLELGDYKIYAEHRTGYMDYGDYCIVIACTFDMDLANAVGDRYAGIYSGLKFLKFDATETGIADLNDFLLTVASGNKSDGIVSIFMMPGQFFKLSTDQADAYPVFLSKHYSSLDGYVPKNKKLFCYPYNMLYVTNLNGVSAEYHYEYHALTDHSTNAIEFDIQCDVSPNPTAMLVPYKYKGSTDFNYNEKMTMDGFPQCAYNIDSFKAWLAQNAVSSGVAIAGGAISTIAGAVTGSAVGVSSGILSIAQSVGQIYTAHTMPPQAHGSTGNSAMVAFGIKDFHFYEMGIRAEFARIIDEYFTMFGYATHRVKVPNRNTRPYWNYVKTISCCLTGSVPFNDMRKIKQIHDNGITYWKSGANVGNYALNNLI